MTNEYLSSDFNYKKYSLEHLENWLHDALNCEDITSQDIYDTIVNCVDENVEYHKKYLSKNIKVFSLLKGQGAINFDVTDKDWNDFWGTNDYSKEQVREFEAKEREYERKRAELDSQHRMELEVIRQAGGFDWTPGV